MADDIKLLLDTTQVLSTAMPPNIKSLKLCRFNNKNPCHLKIIFPPKVQALKFINDFINVGKLLQNVSDLTISVVRD